MCVWMCLRVGLSNYGPEFSFWQHLGRCGSGRSLARDTQVEVRFLSRA